MVRLRFGPPTFDCIRTCEESYWPAEERVECSYCSNNFHPSCIGISRNQALETEWACEECNPGSSNHNTLNTQHLGASNTQNTQLTTCETNIRVGPSTRENDSPIINQLQTHIEVMNREKDNHVQQTEIIQSGLSGLEFQTSTETTDQNNEENNPTSRFKECQSSSQNRQLVTNNGEDNIPMGSDSSTVIISQVTSSQDSQSTTTSKRSEREYYVEEILKHRKLKNGKIEYRVRWKGYDQSEDTWEPETQFVKLYDRLAQYKRSKKLGLPTFPKRYGLINDKKGNEANWITAERTIEIAKSLISKEYKDAIPLKLIIKPERPANNDHIYLIDFQNHTLVGLYYANENMMIVADGENCYLNDPDIRKYIDEWFDITIKPITFHYQSKVDHCASSSAIIIYKFAELYARGQVIPDPLPVSKRRHEFVKKLLHREESITINSRKPVSQYPIYKCEFPGCNFQTRKRDARVLKRHQLSHQK